MMVQTLVRKFSRALANSVADEMTGRLMAACTRLEAAGSLRRLKPQVGDIELVYISRQRQVPEAGALFGTVEEAEAEVAIQRMLAAGVLAKRPNVAGLPTWGPQNKLALHVATGIPVDLFATTEECWWNYLVCRTGPADLNTKIAQAARKRGLLWHPYEKGFTRNDGSGEWLVMRSEREVFEAVGLPYREPRER
jgi:DNA polymerase/3'-5' exonuclease PolX